MRRILVVEDDALIGFVLEDMLTEIGYEVIGPMLSLSEGLAAVAEHAFDLALLDVNLGGEDSSPIAEALQARDIPYILATGYAAADVKGADRCSGVLSKPFDHEALASVLRQAEARSNGG